MIMKSKFTSPVIKAMAYYVYLYSHPETGEVFYVGKGKGNRVFHHLDEQRESAKVNMIKEIRSQGMEPRIEILIHGLEDEATALRVESSIIDLMGIDNLTNKQSGFKSATYGRMTIDQLNAAYDKRKTEITEPAVMIRINKAFRYSMTDMELYDYTRGQWVLSPENASKAKYAFSIYQGIIQEVYEVLQWFPAGSTYSVRQGPNNVDIKELETLEGRYEFVGNLAPEEIRKKYKYKAVDHYFKKGNSNPIMYLNFPS